MNGLMGLMEAGKQGFMALTNAVPATLLNFFKPQELNRPPPVLSPQPIKFEKLEISNLNLPPLIKDVFVKSINQAIGAYNIAKTSQSKKEALDRMMAAIKYVDVHTPPQTLAKADTFHNLKSDLFQKIKQAYAEIGVRSMAKEGSPPIADILSNMSQEYADELMDILLRNKKNKSELKKNLTSLYPRDDITPEAQAWKNFLSEHSIEFLGGGNSSNFKVTNIQDNSVNVLKVDNRLFNPRNVEQHLRENTSGILTPIDADRQVKGISPNNISRTLLVTDFCPLGSLDSYSTKRQGTEKYLTTSILMGQMADAFKSIQDAHCMFPDAKAQNWLIDSNGRIRIADTKSFLFTNELGMYNIYVPGNEYTGMLHTEGYLTSEMKQFYENKIDSLNAEKVHRSLLGRNIYECLTGTWPKSFDFNHPIFRTELGIEYQQLIGNLVKDPPENRMSLEDAKKELQRLGMKSSSEYQQLMTKYESVTRGTSLDLKSFVDNQLVLALPGQNLSKCIKTIDSSLSQLKTLSDRCDNLIKEISGVSINGHSLQTEASLVSQKKYAINNATSIDDLQNKLQNLNISLTQLHKDNALIIKYQQLKTDIESLKFGESDSKMQTYLNNCDDAIYQNGAINLNALQQQIKGMQKVHEGLSKLENQKVREIIEKYDDKKTEWFSVNMHKKARMIEKAMASIPIEERANLLKSTASEVQDLFKALAWHRINPFAKHVDDKGNIVDSSSANTFKKFKRNFIDKKVEEPDNTSEQTNPKTPGSNF
jgi:hypothetical protein